MEKRFYAGIGSRKTPREVCEIMKRLATFFEEEGYILRSGGARGADKAFESGVRDPKNKEIFTAEDATKEAIQLAADYHPAWYRCNPYAQKLHGRNMMIVSGKDLSTPVKLIVCWTPNGATAGGTGQALRYGSSLGISILNLAICSGFSVVSYVRQNL